MADRKPKINIQRSKGTPRPKPIRPTPSPKFEIPFSSPDYNIPEEPENEDEDTSTKPNVTDVNDSPPPLPPTPPPTVNLDQERQIESEYNLTGSNTNIDLESISSSENQKTSKHGKIVYRLSSSSFRPVGWGFIKVSVVGLCFSALIGVIFALLSTKHTLDLETEMFKYPPENDFHSKMTMRRSSDSLNTSMNGTVCLNKPPPTTKCMVSDWNKKTYDKGTIIIYQCTDEKQSLAMIVICDYATTKWVAIKNITRKCCEFKNSGKLL